MDELTAKIEGVEAVKKDPEQKPGRINYSNYFFFRFIISKSDLFKNDTYI